MQDRLYGELVENTKKPSGNKHEKRLVPDLVLISWIKLLYVRLHYTSAIWIA